MNVNSPDRRELRGQSGYVRNPEYPAQILPLLETCGADSSASLKAHEILQQLQRFGLGTSVVGFGASLRCAPAYGVRNKSLFCAFYGTSAQPCSAFGSRPLRN